VKGLEQIRGEMRGFVHSSQGRSMLRPYTWHLLLGVVTVLGVVGVLGVLGMLTQADAQPDRSLADASRPGAKRDVILATTTSTQDSGLLDVLVPLFEKETGFRVKSVSVGTGAALALGARGEADVVLVHAPDAEGEWMAQGNGTERRLVMQNDFVIVGPPSDPAGVRGAPSVLDALRRIAARGSVWISRDDNSGTAQLEQRLWREAGLHPRAEPWYVATGLGMAPSLMLADQRDGYTLADRGTYLARRQATRSALLLEGDSRLLNLYHVMPVNAEKFGSGVNAAGGQALAAFLVSPAAQRLIAEYGRDRYGQPLFRPSAGTHSGDRDLTQQ
jgi:tungstate transport system substrate-binding protein